MYTGKRESIRIKLEENTAYGVVMKNLTPLATVGVHNPLNCTESLQIEIQDNCAYVGIKKRDYQRKVTNKEQSSAA